MLQVTCDDGLKSFYFAFRECGLIKANFWFVNVGDNSRTDRQF